MSVSSYVLPTESHIAPLGEEAAEGEGWREGGEEAREKYKRNGGRDRGREGGRERAREGVYLRQWPNRCLFLFPWS